MYQHLQIIYNRKVFMLTKFCFFFKKEQNVSFTFSFNFQTRYFSTMPENWQENILHSIILSEKIKKKE